MSSWMIYGANGYTGRLIAEEACKRGLRPVLAGRNESQVRELAKRLELEYRVFPLENAEQTAENIADMEVVLHCAGPFSRTARIMLEACMLSKSNYMDITGEMSVFEYIFSQDKALRDAGICALPGVGFDVVPSDCLSAMLKRELPDASHLHLIISGGGGGISPGTTKTILEHLDQGVFVRHNGRLEQVKAGSISRRFTHLGRRKMVALSIPWGDLVSAYYSTGIKNIETYMAVPEKISTAIYFGKLAGSVVHSPIAIRTLQTMAGMFISGPSKEVRETGRAMVWGQVVNDRAETKQLVLRCPESYALTADSAVTCLENILTSSRPGAYTASMLFGPDFIFELNGISVERN